MTDKLAKATYDELVRVANFQVVALGDVDQEMIRKYLCTTAWMRRCKAAQVYSKAVNPYRAYEKTVAIPTQWYQVLISIGQAYDSDYAIRFVPGTQMDENDLVSPSELVLVSDLMFRLQRSGFEVVAGIPKDVEGELGFMAMQHFDGECLSYRRDHPVYGFLASYFAGKEISEALGALVRVTYGYDTDYEVMLNQVFGSKS